MKKIYLAAVLMAGLSVTVQAQVYRPWSGDKVYSLQVGTFYPGEPDFGSAAASDLKRDVPLSVTLGYAREQASGQHFVYGWEWGLNYSRFGFDYTLDGDLTGGNPGKRTFCSDKLWQLMLELRLAGGWYFTESFRLGLSAGLYSGVANGGSSESYTEDKTTGLMGEPEKVNHPASIFDFGVGLSLQLDGSWYFNDNFFATLSVKYLHPFSTTLGIEEWRGEVLRNVERYGVMVGVGYKILN